ncbi:MAG: glycosyltransferase family 39 protein [Alphaproteobacteria bacterium]|nr:glycosyltransferase family 39 protein [Alphaproteobacteria bacterium]
MKRDDLSIKIFDGLAILAVAFLFFLELCRIYSGGVSSDDFEHLSSAWWIYNGYEPYRDFFQHHNPLFWYLIQPFFSLVNHPLEAFFLLRQFVCFCHIVDLLLIFLITRLLGGSKRVALYALLIYFSYPLLFLFYYIQGRPDNPMLTSLLLGVYFWIQFFQKQKRVFLILCYAFLFLSFAFLQKVILFFIPFGIYQLYLLYRKKLSWKDVGYALIFPVSITIGYALYLYHIGMLWRYIELNWILNFYFFRDYKIYRLTVYDWIYHFLFCTFLIYGILKGKGLIRQLSVLLLGFSCLFFMIPKPYRYYYMLFAPFMSIVVALGIDGIKKKYFKMLIISFCLICASRSFLRCSKAIEPPVIYKFMSYFKELEKLSENEWMNYNSPTIFSLYLKKPRQYYWYNLGRGALWDMHLFHRHEIQNYDNWIYQNKPLIIIGYRILNYMHTPDKKSTDVLMELDEEFLNKYYEEPETDIKVYRLKTYNAKRNKEGLL